jgi:hypothetical protein
VERAALAQIWDHIDAQKPTYLLLDESTSSLDLAHQHQLLNLLREIAGQEVTVFAIIHDLNMPIRLSCSKIEIYWLRARPGKFFKLRCWSVFLTALLKLFRIRITNVRWYWRHKQKMGPSLQQLNIDFLLSQE